eukprot:TRINITY_DN19924_c1_g4_i3.p1 TRINITY_DN19924_c1_g4~~TRINITY_DN19924_c1_g4_i3.p1  ORF type:complete len:217 (+),score=0.81 TRINITY_DN19924_c1_g4_i3:1322-1972(+)
MVVQRVVLNQMVYQFQVTTRKQQLRNTGMCVFRLLKSVQQFNATLHVSENKTVIEIVEPIIKLKQNEPNKNANAGIHNSILCTHSSAFCGSWSRQNPEFGRKNKIKLASSHNIRCHHKIQFLNITNFLGQVQTILLKMNQSNKTIHYQSKVKAQEIHQPPYHTQITTKILFQGSQFQKGKKKLKKIIHGKQKKTEELKSSQYFDSGKFSTILPPMK